MVTPEEKSFALDKFCNKVLIPLTDYADFDCFIDALHRTKAKNKNHL